MGWLNLGGRLRRREDREIVHECRRCGKSVEPGTDICPACDEPSIVRYEFE